MLSVNIPPLRVRNEDLRPLIEHFLKKYSSLNQNLTTRVNLDFGEALKRVELPGNARQLENIVRTAILNKVDDSPLGLCDLTPALWQQISDEAPLTAESSDNESESTSEEQSNVDSQSYFRSILDENSWNLPRSLEYCEKLLLQCVLQSACGNQSKAARLIGITRGASTTSCTNTSCILISPPLECAISTRQRLWRFNKENNFRVGNVLPETVFCVLHRRGSLEIDSLHYLN